jgi:hypothetical protein
MFVVQLLQHETEPVCHNFVGNAAIFNRKEGDMFSGTMVSTYETTGRHSPEE